MSGLHFLYSFLETINRDTAQAGKGVQLVEQEETRKAGLGHL